MGDCEACDQALGSGRLCRRCWAAVKKGTCPFCFEQMKPAPQGRRKVWAHTKTPCRLADPGWGDVIPGTGGAVDERPRVILVDA